MQKELLTINMFPESEVKTKNIKSILDINFLKNSDG